MILDFMASLRSELKQKAQLITNKIINKCFHVFRSISVTSCVDHTGHLDLTSLFLVHETPQASN